jgi:hypothetical protein
MTGYRIVFRQVPTFRGTKKLKMTGSFEMLALVCYDYGTCRNTLVFISIVVAA